ncbi:UDP-N-acetylmuramoyl-tripeptide--D-alanyl-D-alanine ligase [Nemorincola caseinilytica]|uniref:UDP-N-acetylmuramoyl-tripeptide--D-alanyl-D-alanine ligase n=1 Tax=Nemorincola caseinilytica TaxID=2054315 RepID=A0ABP8NBR5_9BACT
MSITELYDIFLRHPIILTDTRKIRPGGIFFALKGASFNGNTFAAAALDAGAAYAVVDEQEYAKDERCILVADALATLQQLARHHRRQFNIPVIAITGSNGKTTTKELVTAVLRQQYTTYATTGNLNNHIGVPLTLLQIQKDAQVAVVEMGANHQKEIESYCLVAEPTHGIITNCGKAHIEGFGGEEGVRKGKGELYDYLRTHNGTVFRNTDMEYLQQMAAGVVQQVTYGAGNATYTGSPVMKDVFLSVVFSHTGTDVRIDTHLVGAYNFPNVLTAIAVGLHFGIAPTAIKAAIEAYMPDNSRSQWIQKGTNKVILDAYNANPSSMQAAITNFAASPLNNRILWIGAMKEMGPAEADEHRALVTLINSYEWKDVILVGKEFSGLQNGLRWFADSTEAAAYVRAHQPQDSAILIKGSRGSRMEVMADALV